ncbi:MAG: hypothetical protein ACJ8FY_07520 [Gemmataceae bacterium]
MLNAVWVFNGEGGIFPAAVFSSRQKAEEWIARCKLSGCLTKYPMDNAVYDWVIAQGYWSPKEAHQREAKFIQSFSSAHLEHYHYEAGSEPV